MISRRFSRCLKARMLTLGSWRRRTFHSFISRLTPLGLGLNYNPHTPRIIIKTTHNEKRNSLIFILNGTLAKTIFGIAKWIHLMQSDASRHRVGHYTPRICKTHDKREALCKKFFLHSIPNYINRIQSIS